MPTSKTTLKVSQALQMANGALASIPNLRVVGEVSGFRGPNARSGHCYFSLKDDSASMECIIWRSLYQRSGIQLRDGLMIELSGAFNIYEGSGKMSFVAKSVAVAGEGLLRQQIAELAAKLQAEGLMADSRKRPIPRFCERIAVCTSLSGSVIEDVKRTLARRNPLVQISVVGCAVQGVHAPATIVRALQVAATADVECILLVRGGGSLEDLMAFNDESVARAIVASPIPIVTGIGHEPDTSIADMVADRRTSTPTAAAESVAPAFDEIVMTINERHQRLVAALGGQVSSELQQVNREADAMVRAMGTKLASIRQRLELLADRRCLQEPAYLISEREAALELSAQRLIDALPRVLSTFEVKTEAIIQRLSDALPRRLNTMSSQVQYLQANLRTQGQNLTRPYSASLERSAASLSALSPLNVLQRGYAIVRDDKNHVLTDTSTVRERKSVSVTLAHGSFEAEVTHVK